jgi:hypothetical protein
VVCGTPDGTIGIFNIPASDANKAAALSFASLNDLPEAARVSCR